MLAQLQPELASLPAGQQILSALAHANKAGTSRTYKSTFKRWEKYCAERGVSPYAAQPKDVADYLFYLAPDIKMSSISPYLSVIRKAYEDLALEPPTHSPLVVRVRTHLTNHQIAVRTQLRCQALWAPHLKVIFEKVVEMVLATDWPTSTDDLLMARNLLFVVVLCISGSRPSSIRLLDRAGITTPTDTPGSITLTRTHVKTAADAEEFDVVGKFAVTFPPQPYSNLALSLAKFALARDTFFPEGKYYFQLSAHDCSASAVSAHFSAATEFIHLKPRAGHVYTCKSARRGFVSNGMAVEIPRHRLEYVGGWVPDSSAMVRFYCDHTIEPSHEALFFWGHLRGLTHLNAPSL